MEEHLEATLDAAKEKSEHGFGYPWFVEREFRAFLRCGNLRYGFVRVRCDDCAAEKLIAFCCKRRGICPSCTARRMTDTAAHLVENVFAKVPHRQWVMSFPKRVRFALACDHDLLSRALDLSLKKIFSYQRRRARALGIKKPLCGAVTFCQRFGSLLNLNCHFHSVLPEGVFYEEGDMIGYLALPPPEPEDIERLNRQIAKAVEKLLVKWSNQDRGDEPPTLLALEQGRGIDATSDTHATQETGKRTRKSALSSFLYGYSLHAGRYVDDMDDLEELCRYGARAPVANGRLSLLPDGKVQLSLKRPMYDGRKKLILAPQELLRRLATLIPPPRKNLTRYHGVFAPNHRVRKDIVGVDFFAEDSIEHAVSDADAQEKKTVSQRYRKTWAELLKRVFAIDVLVCDRCQGPMKILAIIPESHVSELILDYLKLEMPKATGPPHELVSPEPH